MAVRVSLVLSDLITTSHLRGAFWWPGFGGMSVQVFSVFVYKKYTMIPSSEKP